MVPALERTVRSVPCRDGPAAPLSLAPGEVGLWLLDYRHALRFAVPPGLLSADERARQAGLTDDVQRRRFQLRCAALRTVLSAYAATPPDAWRFDTGRYGGRHLTPAQAAASGLVFSLSHSSRYTVIGITRQARLGVDVQPVSSSCDLPAIAGRFFAPAERAALAALAPARVPRAFCEHWTFKEAYTKAIGLGLTIALDDIVFDLTASRTVGYTLPAGAIHRSARWHMAQCLLPGRQVLAVCCEHRGPGGMPPTVRRLTSLTSAQAVDIGRWRSTGGHA
ncbi:4'-phosphopantetheinyl transferase superfamily protein [Rugamonas sp. A1-17]|nr:4'-phosphopantetheinyl transferase superfamily protein [Rugamonas sp. A1-17]